MKIRVMFHSTKHAAQTGFHETENSQMAHDPWWWVCSTICDGKKSDDSSASLKQDYQLKLYQMISIGVSSWENILMPTSYWKLFNISIANAL